MKLKTKYKTNQYNEIIASFPKKKRSPNTMVQQQILKIEHAIWRQNSASPRPRLTHGPRPTHAGQSHECKHPRATRILICGHSSNRLHFDISHTKH